MALEKKAIGRMLLAQFLVLSLFTPALLTYRQSDQFLRPTTVRKAVVLKQLSHTDWLFKTSITRRTPSQMPWERHPFDKIVQLSVNCTGTLVTAQHVLTAAHCLHDGTRFIHYASTLTVKLRHQTLRVLQIKVPKAYLRKYDDWQVDKYFFDFAVVKLAKPVSGFKRPLQFERKSQAPEGTFQILAPPNNQTAEDSDQCTVDWQEDSLLLSKCQSFQPQYEGAAAIVQTSKRKWKILGVMSKPIQDIGDHKVFAATVLMTEKNLLLLCKMINDPMFKCAKTAP